MMTRPKYPLTVDINAPVHSIIVFEMRSNQEAGKKETYNSNGTSIPHYPYHDYHLPANAPSPPPVCPYCRYDILGQMLREWWDTSNGADVHEYKV